MAIIIGKRFLEKWRFEKYAQIVIYATVVDPAGLLRSINGVISEEEEQYSFMAVIIVVFIFCGGQLWTIALSRGGSRPPRTQ